MNNLPLQPLVWDWSYGDGGKTSAVCRAKSLSHEYIVRLEQCGYCYVDYRKFDNDENSDNRKDEPPEFNSVKEAQYWVNNTHYPHTMKPYVKPTPTWVDVNEREPNEKGDYLIRDYQGRVAMGKYDKGFYMESGGEKWGCVQFWMPIPEFSTMQNNKGE